MILDIIVSPVLEVKHDEIFAAIVQIIQAWNGWNIWNLLLSYCLEIK